MGSIFLALILALAANCGPDDNSTGPALSAPPGQPASTPPAGSASRENHPSPVLFAPAFDADSAKAIARQARSTPISTPRDKDGELPVPPLEASGDADKLSAEVRALIAEREKTAELARGPDSIDPAEMAKLRLRLAELLTKMSMQKRQEKGEADLAKRLLKQTTTPSTGAKVPEKANQAKASATKAVQTDQRSRGGNSGRESNGTGAAAKAEPGDKGPVDAIALAHALYRTGDYEGALAAYRLINPASLDRVTRVTIHYMAATCLRRMGKSDEAAAMYRDVVNSKDDPFLADCAQWQLSAMRWRRDLEGRLQQLRDRNQALEPKR